MKTTKAATRDQPRATRLRAALAARTDSDFIIIARTDAKGEQGIDGVIARLNAYLAAGADLAMIAEPFGVDELRRIVEEVHGPLAMVGGVAEWPESMLSRDEYAQMGVKLILYAVTGLAAALKAQMAVYADLMQTGGLGAESAGALMSLEDISELMGLANWNAIEAMAADEGR